MTLCIRSPPKTVYAATGDWVLTQECIFAVLTQAMPKSCVLRSVVDLQAVIKRFLNHHNAGSNPFE